MIINPEFSNDPDDDIEESFNTDGVQYIESYNDLPEDVGELIDEQAEKIMELVKESDHKDPFYQHLGFQNVQVQALQRSIVNIQKGMLAMTLAMELLQDKIDE
jgi:hypothetical protein